MTAPAWTRQDGHRVRFEWGPPGIEATAADHVVIVDVLRFSTAVDAAVGRGARVHPCRWNDGSASELAERVGARVADGADPDGPSLSPVRLARLDRGEQIVLPSLNGSTVAALAEQEGATVLAACLRNAAAIGRWLNERDGDVAVIACGERWPDGSLRPALEDHLGAGAVIAELGGSRSPDAEAAAALWRAVRHHAPELVRSAASGLENVARGWADDLAYAVQVGASATVPLLVDGAFVDAGGPQMQA